MAENKEIGGVLNKQDILNARKNGTVVIEPFCEKNLQPNSYDVTLGPYYYTEQRNVPKLWTSPVHNPYDEEDVKSMWGNLKEAATYKETCFLEFGSPMPKGISKTDKVIIIGPGQSILAHTNEFIGGRKNITTMMKARSSIGRNLLTICNCAGLGDVGYVNIWTMEITNRSQNRAIMLVVGRRIGQIVFLRTNELDKEDQYQGKYQKESIEWKPEMMLPKMCNDWEIGNE